MQCAFLLFHPIEGEDGGCSADGAALIVQLFALLPIKGGILFPKRIPPLEPPEKGEGRPPRPPTLQALGLKGCTRCAVEVRCTWLRHESSASRYRQQPRPTPWGASDAPSAADCGAGGGIALLAAAGGCPSIIKNDRISGRFLVPSGHPEQSGQRQQQMPKTYNPCRGSPLRFLQAYRWESVPIYSSSAVRSES